MLKDENHELQKYGKQKIAKKRGMNHCKNLVSILWKESHRKIRNLIEIDENLKNLIRIPKRIFLESLESLESPPGRPGKIKIFAPAFAFFSLDRIIFMLFLRFKG